MKLSFLVRQFLLGISYINLLGKLPSVSECMADCSELDEVSRSAKSPTTVFYCWCAARSLGMWFAFVSALAGIIGAAALAMTNHGQGVEIAVFVVGLLPLIAGHVYAHYCG